MVRRIFVIVKTFYGRGLLTLDNSVHLGICLSDFQSPTEALIRGVQSPTGAPVGITC